MGGPISAGEGPAVNDQGSLESLHNVFHKWVGPVDPPNWDMGDFHTAARDTVFWGHHANVDRMWSLFTASRGNKPEFRSKDWLDASFIFYDDNRQLVKCKVKDCLDTTKLGYTYEPVELPWLNVRRSYIKQKREREKRGVKPEEVEVGAFGSTPRPLAQTIRVLVPRPKTSLTKDDKEEVSEVLTIDDIVIEDETVCQRFDVYVSKPLEGGKATTDLGEFAGAFTYIPVSLSNTKGKTRLTLGITNLVENLEADASENLVVSLIPDLRKCHLATDTQIPEGGNTQVECCPPKYKDKKIIDFKLPEVTQMRTRRPAHKVDSEYIAKYEEAIRKMKALPEDDPWNFYQQAQVHCAFCNGAYDQLGFPGTPLQVHFAFLFLPWHRYYVYFWEKILGKLIGDPTFAIPFWNWDTPAGMYLPSLYKPETSPLYNPHRNPDHNEALINYKYKNGDANPTPEEKDGVILSNLLQIESIFTEGKKNPRLFMGGPIIAGEEPDNDQGSLESLHNVFHLWVGPVDPPNWDMGNFHTAARDTVFWGHHANVDRMWSLFTASRGNKPEFRSKDWLDASFIFYDDNRQLVKCKVRDSLDTTKFGYTYEPVELPWSNVRRSYIKQKREREKRGVKPEEVDVGEFGSTPRPLAQTIRVLVPRPKSSLTKDDKEEVSEVLTIDDIVIEDKTVPQRFDVYVSKPLEGGKATTDFGEFAGAFTYIPVSLSNTKGKTRLTLGITNLVENLEADASENLVVSLIPGIGKVTIGGVKIGLLDVDD